MRRRRIERPLHHDRWLVSYADFITLLFAFFVVLYSAAQLDQRRAGRLATAIQTAFLQRSSLPPKPADVSGLSATGVPSDLPIGNTEDDEFSLLKGQIEQALAGEITAGDVAVRRTSEGLVISLREVGFLRAVRPKSRPVRSPPSRGWRRYCGRRLATSASKATLTMFLSTTRGSPRTGTSPQRAQPPRCVC